MQARVERVIYGMPDPKAGCVGTLLNLLQDDRLNHQAEMMMGIEQEACSQLLTDFFRRLQQKKKQR